MSHQTDTGTEPVTGASLGPAGARSSSRPGPGAPASSAPADGSLSRIACQVCGRWFTTPDGLGMLASLKGHCPDCGGRFVLLR